MQRHQKALAADVSFNSRRSPVFSTNGMVACSQPLAAQIGVDILRRGGNAVDAAIAVAAALNVTEPCSTGLGGDCFILFYEAATKKVHSLNGSGRAPAGLSRSRVMADCGLDPPSSPLDADGNATLGDLNPYHAHTVTVPGAAAGWCDAVDRWGSTKLSLGAILQPAADLARRGFPVSPITAHWWHQGEGQLRNGPHAKELMVKDDRGTTTTTFRAPRAGEVFSNANLASVLERVGEHGKAGFYEGPIAEAIVAVLNELGGCMTLEDLANHETTFPDAIFTSYQGVDLVECPPNGQGLIALLATNFLKCALQHPFYQKFQQPLQGCDTPDPSATPSPSTAGMQHNSAAYLHVVIECLRLAFADGRMFIGDPEIKNSGMEKTTAALLSPEYARKRVSSLFKPERACVDARAGAPLLACDTVSFQVVDAAGNAVSMVNSNYMGFGSGIIPKGVGFSLQNRGANFSIVDGHANVVAGNKRPYHTILPALLVDSASRDIAASFTVMGGFMQPQGHLQVLLNLVDHGMGPQAALDAPRICLNPDGSVALEEGISDAVAQELRALGHDVHFVKGHGRALFGRGQIISVNHGARVLSGGGRDEEEEESKAGGGGGGEHGASDPVRVLVGGSDGRADGCALGS